MIADSATLGRSFLPSVIIWRSRKSSWKTPLGKQKCHGYPENQSDLHLGDALFYNMGTQLRKNEIESNTAAYDQAYKTDMLFLYSFISDVFSGI